MLPFARPIAGIAVFLGVSAPFVLPRVSVTTPPVNTRQVGEVNTGSLVNVLVTANAPIQDTRPNVLHRGTQLDGMLRAAPAQRMAIHANPFENAWRAANVGGLDLATGSYSVQEIDIALPATGFSWVLGRSYSSRQEAGGSHMDSNGVNGRNFFQASQPSIVLYDTTGTANDMVYLMNGADRFAEYKRVDNGGVTGDTFAGVNGAAGVFLFTSGSPDTYKLTDQNGNELTFLGFDAGVASGQLWTIVDPAGNKAYVGHATSAASAITDGYDAGGRMATAYDTSGRRYTYTYTQLDSVYRLTEVKAEKNTGSWVTVAEVDYGYYTDETYGDVGDLKTVTITTPLSDSGVSLVRKKYYRYWEGTYDATTNPGYPHALQYVVDFEGVRRFDWSDSTFDDDHLTASETSLKPYATAFFKYDSSHRVKEAWFNGECGCSGANNGTFHFEYESNASFSGTSGYDSGWKTRTVVERPDASYMTQYWDEVGQPLSRVITDIDPDSTSPAPNRWVTGVERDAQGCVTKIATPANCTGYTHSTGAITASSSEGVIWEFTRETSGALKGFAEEKRYRIGTSGTAYFASETGFTQSDKTIVAGGSAGAVDVTRPGISAGTRYPQTTSTSSATYKDTHTLDWDGTHELSLASDLVTEPAITSGNNGSGTANTHTTYFRTDGTVSYQKARDAVLSYRAYTDGKVTTSIEDADTTVLTDEPAGLSSTAGAYHRATTYTYDAQGRVDVITASDGRKTKHYYSKLADGRSIELVYADYETTPKFYGPVEYTVRNQAGEVEAQATVALTSNESTSALTAHVDETDADLITAMDLGSVVRLSTQILNESGHTVEESRLYFDVPTSGAGTDGTNYDATFFGYDVNGRRVRVKEPHGTIWRRVFNVPGRVTGRFVGTNDHDFGGGEASGTDNMVQTEALAYDGGADDGNGYLTSRTAYVVDGTTNQRVTTYSHDARGRVLLQTNPTAPHAFHKYDNEGRNVATGLFSSTTNIVVGTDDPTTENSNRLALTETAYDEVGQAWKTTRHKITAGASDDTLTSQTWRDASGRVIKEVGSRHAKTFYDRLGRTTHRFVLATNNDTTYAHADDVTGDWVLEENQAVYESEDSEEVWMSVRIDRKHTDFAGVSPTTGPLDTNADGDAMMLTSSNIKGRAQIACMWYDRFGRATDRVKYGNYNGSTFDRAPSTPLSVPSRSDTELVTSYAYDDAQGYTATTDPKGLVARVVVDDAGRTTSEVRNYSNGTPANPDDNQTVKYEYVDGLRTKIIADMPSGESDQETLYIYGTTAGTPAAQVLSTGDGLRGVKFPDSTNTGTTSLNINSDSSDVVSYAYNAQGQEIYKKDQAGNVYESDYDTSSRRTHERVTTLASGFDSAVRRKSWTYDSLGRSSLVTQYDNATVGSGSVTDEVSYTYDGWGGITNYKQDKDSAVGTGASYDVTYTYAKATGGRQTMRRDLMTLPGGKAITIDYTKDKDDEISRVSKLKDGATTLAKYEYLGASRAVGTIYSQPNIARTEYDTFSDSYTNYLDSFNRVVSSTWWTLAPNPDKVFYDCDISYDRNSNITWVEDNVHAGFDVKYTMDDLDRLVDAEEGTRSGSSIATRTRQQIWTTLDHVGNWDVSKLDLNGDGDFVDTDELNETRTNNAVNELSTRDTDTNGTANYTLAYDAAGNMTDDGEDYKYEYDAFYRLRKVKNQSSTLLAEYRYNGLGHMIGVHEDVEPDIDLDGNDPWFYPAYDEGWREVARYRDADSAPKEQFVNAMAGLDGYGRSSYINDVVCRERDNTSGWLAASDGTLEERYFYCPNWRGDVSALVTSGRNLHEMVKYSPYGVPFGLPGGDTNSDGDNDNAGANNDIDQIQTWIDTSSYDVRGDVDLDGDVDNTDKTLTQAAPIGGGLLGRGSHSNNSIRSRRGMGGKEALLVGDQYHARNRVLLQKTGSWLQRDPLKSQPIREAYLYVGDNPLMYLDPMGLQGGDGLGLDLDLLGLGAPAPGDPDFVGPTIPTGGSEGGPEEPPSVGKGLNGGAQGTDGWSGLPDWIECMENSTAGIPGGGIFGPGFTDPSSPCKCIPLGVTVRFPSGPEDEDNGLDEPDIGIGFYFCTGA